MTAKAPRLPGTRSASTAPLLVLLLLAPWACTTPPPAPAGPVPVIRLGPDRGTAAYAEKEPEAKARLFRKINAERAAAGREPLAYDLVGAKAGDAFCQESAATGSVGHWDVHGRAPYLRWAQAGGVDYHGENFGSMSRSGAPIRESVAEMLLETHERMMAERPPDDGHRQAVLSPLYTHVGIGVAVVGGEFRMTEEYSRRVATWVEIPARPVKTGGSAPFALQLPEGWNAGAIEIAFEPIPKPLSVAEIKRRGGYRYPPAIRQLLPLLPQGMTWPGGARGDFGVSAGRLSASVSLSSGKGNYYVLVYAGRGDVAGQKLSPITGALVVAE